MIWIDAPAVSALDRIARTQGVGDHSGAEQEDDKACRGTRGGRNGGGKNKAMTRVTRHGGILKK